MNDKSRTLFRAIAVALCLAVVAPAAWKSAQAADTTKVSGMVTDPSGKPLEKVEIWFENAKIQGKRVGPVKTNKKGKYIYPYLDVGIEPEWRVVPKLEGFLILRMNWKLIDSQRNDRGSNTDTILNAKQEIPPLHPVLVGDTGVNEINFVMVKEAEFNTALRQAVSGNKGGGAAPAAAPAAEAPAAPGAAAAPAAAPASSHTVTEAVDLIKAGKSEEAIPILKEYVDKNPENAPIQFTLAKAYINAKQYDAAVAPLQKTLQLKPDQPGAHFYLGIAYSQMGQDADALKEFEAEIPISPEQDAAYSNAASLYDKAGNTDKALEYYKKAVEIAPQRADLHASLASLYEKKGDQASAQLEYKALADVDPGNAAVTWYNVGAIAKNSDKNDEAVKAFQKAIELNPKYAIAHRELGYALVKQGDFKGAVVHFNKYLELEPKASDAGEIKVMAKQLSQ